MHMGPRSKLDGGSEGPQGPDRALEDNPSSLLFGNHVKQIKCHPCQVPAGLILFLILHPPSRHLQFTEPLPPYSQSDSGTAWLGRWGQGVVRDVYPT
jgi:hypothetical protein